MTQQSEAVGHAGTERARITAYPWDTGRDPAVDLLRGVAVVCMIIAHVRVWAPTDAVPVKLTLLMVNNVASPLFALVMGVSAGIVLTRRRHRAAGATFVVRNVVRGLILIALGVLLQQLGTFVAIVLMSLGATLVVASPLALLPVPILAVTTVATFAIGPWVNAAARAGLDPARVYGTAWVDQVLQWLVLSTHYRVVSLLPFVLAGVLLARYRLTVRTALTSIGVGVLAGAAVIVLRLLGHGHGVSEIVSGGVPDALLDVALAGTALGVIVLLARWAPMAPAVTVLMPVRAVGAMALTAYVLHVCLIALAQRSVLVEDPRAPYEHWLLYGGGILVITVLACWAWWRLLGKGPIERAMGLVTDRIG
ncbi:DUF418 domain-containing protein [Janibacter limosus]|uniref:DUF418 domain-containing protein n=1 Tax=Janibacter limosus TaxID=53458 RepID=UPI000834C8AF|nr:DUF418 domain-containing protein [Janibacter limosus]